MFNQIIISYESAVIITKPYIIMADELKSFKVQVLSVITTNKEGGPLVKTRANGDTAPYSLCGVKFLEGPLAGKSTWAQRTLLNREGVVKDNVAKGDECYVIATVVDNKPFFEISTAVNATDEELLAMLGESVGAGEQPEIKLAEAEKAV